MVFSDAMEEARDGWLGVDGSSTFIVDVHVISIEVWESRGKKMRRRIAALLYRYGSITVPVESYLEVRIGGAL